MGTICKFVAQNPLKRRKPTHRPAQISTLLVGFGVPHALPSFAGLSRSYGKRFPQNSVLRAASDVGLGAGFVRAGTG
jgi:hypothetical protein